MPTLRERIAVLATTMAIEVKALRIACGPSSEAFSTQIKFAGSPIVYAQKAIAEPLAFTIAPNPVPGTSAIFSLIANGNAAHVPVFPGEQLVGSAGWANTAGALNLVSFSYLYGKAYYSINQPIPVSGTPPSIDPNTEQFINFVRRTPDLLLAGTTYSTSGAASHFSTYAQSETKLTGNGYFVVGPSSNSHIIGLSNSSNLGNHGGWLYRATRYGPTGGCIYHYNSVVRGDFPTGATDDIRFLRTGSVIALQSKAASAASWTTRYTYPEPASGSLWMNFSLGTEAGAGPGSSLVNPRSLGAT